MQSLSNSMANNCAVGCKGYWLTMTGDFSKDVTEKPANRQAGKMSRHHYFSQKSRYDPHSSP